MDGIRFEGYDRVWYLMAPARPVVRAEYGPEACEIFEAGDLETSLFSIGRPDPGLAKEAARVYAGAFNEGERYGRIVAQQGVQGAVLGALGLGSLLDRLRALETRAEA